MLSPAISAIDFGLLGALREFRGLLSGPFQGSEELVFVGLGLFGIVLFTFLVPVERIVADYTAHRLAHEAGVLAAPLGFPYIRLFVSWVCVCVLLGFNVLLLTMGFDP